MTYMVVVSATAEADLFAVYDYIAERAGAEIALRFVEAIEAYCLGFANVPERRTRRHDLRPGLRTVVFRRRATILFEVDRAARRVVIHGVYYAGRSLEGFEEEDAEQRSVQIGITSVLRKPLAARGKQVTIVG